jgi:hypothetical protein
MRSEKTGEERERQKKKKKKRVSLTWILEV